jgi:hypothetical protein
MKFHYLLGAATLMLSLVAGSGVSDHHEKGKPSQFRPFPHRQQFRRGHMALCRSPAGFWC